MSDLFRHEVLDARRSQWLGRVSLAQPLSVWILALFAALAAAGVTCLLLFGEYARRTRVVGQLVPSAGLITIIAPATGVLSGVGVTEGGVVLQGSTIAQVNVPSANSTTANWVDAVGGQIAERADASGASYGAQLEQLQARDAGLRRQLRALQTEIQALRNEKSIRQKQLILGEESLQRFRQLRDRQYITALQWQQQESQWLEQQAAVQLLQRNEATLARQAASLQQELAELPAQRRAIASTQRRDAAAFSQERLEAAARGDAVIKAPTTGRVTALLGLPGQAVEQGQPLLTLLPATSPLEAHLLVPSRAIGFISPGDRVRLRYHAFPYQKFGQGQGQVLRVSRSALSAGDMAALAVGGQGNEPLYRVIVGLDRQTVRAFGSEEPLKPGMLLEADVMGDQRRLWEWLLEPLFSVTGTL